MRRLLIVTLLLAASLPAAVGTAWAETRAEARRAELDRLFKSLKAAPSEQVAALLEGRIHTLWLQQGSPAATLLLARGERDMQGNAPGAAVTDFDAVLTLEPDYAEAFNHRAAARAMLGDYAGALADIEQVLKREPRQFSALQGLSHIAEQQGNWKGALAAWQKSLDIDPRTPGGLERLEALQKKVDGEGI
jgi:tetratricopeptide (TPR) repeat protein